MVKIMQMEFTFKAVLRVVIIGMLPVSLWCGDISGTVTYSSAARETPVMLSPYGRNIYRPPVKTPAGPSDETIILYLEDIQVLRGPAGDSVKIVDQRHISIQPHVTSVVLGSTVEFLNSDSVYHNLFSLSGPKPFNLGRYPRGESRRVTFDRPGEVEIFCDIHAEMNGVVLVLPNRYFTRVGRDGRYRIRDVPPGEYRIRAWREKSPGAEATVTVPPDAAEVTVDFSL